MRLLLAFLLLMPLAAQEPPQKPAEPAAEAKPAEEAKPADAKAEAKAASPFPAEDSWVSGSVDVGYRWVQDVKGSSNTYRSVVNLAEGVRLMGLDLTLKDPKKRAFDRADLFVHSWGDPYNTLRADVFKSGWYRFLADYRSTNYFDNLASYANPLLQQGNTLSERAFDTQKKYANVEFEVLPGRWITPYFAYTRNWDDGTAIAPFFTDGNEYAVPMSLKDRTDHYRGGVRLQFKNYHATFEQGATQYSESAAVDFNSRHYGNRLTPVFGQPLILNKLTQLYGIDGDGNYSRIMVSGSPAKWVNFFGQFLYSQPKTNATYNDAASGLFVMLNTLRFYNGLQDSVSSMSTQPHTSGYAGVEVKPFNWMRFMYSYTTDRYHNANSALLAEQVLFGGTVPPEAQRSYFIEKSYYNYNQHRGDVFFDITKKLSVRGGFRYVWGDAKFRPASLNQYTTLEGGELQQKIGSAGITYRPGQKWSLSADYEGGTSPMTYFRTSLRDYNRLRTRGRYQVNQSLLFSGSFSLLDNQNPTPGLNYDMHQQTASLSVQWTPKGAKMFSLLGDYTRSTFQSNINALDPTFLTPILSAYRDNAHVATALGEFSFPAFAGRTVKADFGGSLFVSSGTRPTSYYQPIGRLVIPIVKKVSWYGEWRWYGFTETFYLYENFRTNHFLTGLRFSL
jgi:hypothetical protein